MWQHVSNLKCIHLSARIIVEASSALFMFSRGHNFVRVCACVCVCIRIFMVTFVVVKDRNDLSVY